MNILVLASSPRGGGVQVAVSVIRNLRRFSNDFFLVCASDAVRGELAATDAASNVKICDIPKTPGFFRLFSRNPGLDDLVREYRIDAVFTVFGPSYWRPKVPHLCGFAIAHYVYPDSAFSRRRSFKERVCIGLKKIVQLHSFRRDTDALVVENPDVTERLRKIFPGKPVETVWNCYNQVFDHPETQKEHPLPKFRGTTLLTVSAFYPHKNFPVLVGAAEYLATHHPDSDFRFVLTLTPDAFPVPEKLKRHFIFTGKVKIEECPSLYRQADLMILPTLLECFSASWAEAMKTGVPILTSDLPFARGICGGAAVYFDPLSPEDVAGKIFDLSGDPARRAVLAERGKERLRLFDTPETRTEKYIALVKSIAESVRVKKATG